MEFVKFQGLGNDFIIVDQFTNGAVKFQRELVPPLCSRGTGVGADGVILAERPSSEADARMIIYNPDGSEAEMCGNGIRCLAAYLWAEGLVGSNPMLIETRAGAKSVELIMSDDRVDEACVDMGLPEFSRAAIPMTGEGSQAVEETLEAEGGPYKATCVSMGNPHCVIFSDDVDGVPLERVGPSIENHPFFPVRTNVEFVQVVDEGHIKVRVWERGAGITLACGTGACASFAATLATRGGNDRMRVDLPGGSLTINRDDTGHIFMRGRVLEVYRASISEQWLAYFNKVT